MKREEKENLKKLIYDEYCVEGIASACDLANTYHNIVYRFCPACAADTPVIHGDTDCIICGQETECIKSDDFTPENRLP